MTRRIRALQPSEVTTDGRADAPSATPAPRPRILVIQDEGQISPLADRLRGLMPHAVVQSCPIDQLPDRQTLDRSDIDLILVGACNENKSCVPAMLDPSGDAAPHCHVMICYSECSGSCARNLVRSGVSALVPDSVEPSVLVQVIELVLSGLRYVPPDLIMDAGTNGSGARASLMADLSPREREVAGFLARGQSNKEIARRLGLSEITIKVHVSNLLRKLRARNRTEAASQLLASGSLPMEAPHALN